MTHLWAGRRRLRRCVVGPLSADKLPPRALNPASPRSKSGPSDFLNRLSGSIKYDCVTKKLGREKAVDVHLATDLLRLKDIYDAAIIVSGDQDYVPAVQAVKDFGKHVVNVSFRERGGKLLPGGARRLNQIADDSLEISYQDTLGFMNFIPDSERSN